MQTNEIILLSYIAVVASLILFMLFSKQIGRLTGRIYCLFGKHKFKTYRCIRCKKAKKHPHLKLLDGGKKVIENNLRF